MSFGHSKSFGLLKQTKRNGQSGVIVEIMDKLCGFLLCFLHVLRTLKITAFQALERGRRQPQGLLCRPPRPGCLHNICGPDCFVGGWWLVWEESLDWYHKHDPHTDSATATVSDSATAHGHGPGHGLGLGPGLDSSFLLRSSALFFCTGLFLYSTLARLFLFSPGGWNNQQTKGQ